MDKVIDSEGCLTSTCRSLIFFLQGAVADFALLMSLDLAIKDDIVFHTVDTMLLQWLLEIVFPCKSLHARENKFAPVLGQNFTGHRV